MKKQQSKIQTKDGFLSHIFKYLERSSIKSFNYIADEKSRTAKVLWLVLSIYILYEIVVTTSTFYEQVHSNSIAVDGNSNPESIDKIPFPAVTIVSDLQNYQKEIAGDYKNFHLAKSKGEFPNTTWIDILREKYLNSTLFASYLGCHWHGKLELEKVDFNFTNNSEVANYFLSLDSNFRWFDDRIASWNSRISPSFQKIFVKHGYAHTFNMINLGEFFNLSVVSDDFYVTRDYNESTPWSSQSNGESVFSITLQRNQYLDKEMSLCHFNGFLVHNPYEIPASQHTNFISFGSTTEVSVSVDVYQADKSIFSIPIEKRGCYLKHERKLKFFKIYTKNGCLKECLTFYTHDTCGCAPHHYVRSKSMKVCDIKGLACSADLIPTVNVEKLDKIYASKGICNCIDTCDQVNYYIDAKTKKYDTNYNEK